MFKDVAIIRVALIILWLHFGHFSVKIMFLLQLLFPHQVWRAIQGQFLRAKLICRACAKLWLQTRLRIPVLQRRDPDITIATCLLVELVIEFLLESTINDRQIALWSYLWFSLIIQHQLLLSRIVLLLKLAFTTKICCRLVESIRFLSHLDTQFVAGFHWLQLSYWALICRVQSIISAAGGLEFRIVDRFDQLCVFERWNPKLHLGS